MAAMEDPKDIQLKNIETVREMARKTMSCLTYLTDESEKLDCLMTLEEVLQDCAIAEHQITESQRAAFEATGEVLQEMDAAMQVGTKLTSVDHFSKMYDSVLDEKLSYEPEDAICAADNEVQVVREAMQALQVDRKGQESVDSEELVATMEEINIIDPISKRPMTDPVRNRICGHVYEKSSVLGMIKQSRRKGFKCPAMGCSNRSLISPDVLQPATDVMLAIRHSQK